MSLTNVDSMKVRTKNKRYQKRKNWCCNRCNNNSFELVASTDNDREVIIVCSNCQAIANEHGEIFEDKHPSSQLMTLKIR